MEEKDRKKSLSDIRNNIKPFNIYVTGEKKKKTIHVTEGEKRRGKCPLWRRRAGIEKYLKNRLKENFINLKSNKHSGTYTGPTIIS